jgi:hypothetical protein
MRLGWYLPKIEKITLSMKQGSLFVLFCLYLSDPPNGDASDCILGLYSWSLWKALDAKGCLGLVP